MIDFLCTARTREDMELLAQAQGFMDKEGNPASGVDFYPTPGSPAYEAGIAIQPPEDWQDEWLPEWHFNLRVSGELEQEQIEGIPQYDPKDGSLLPLRERTKFGIAMTEGGTPWTGRTASLPALANSA